MHDTLEQIRHSCEWMRAARINIRAAMRDLQFRPSYETEARQALVDALSEYMADICQIETAIRIYENLPIQLDATAEEIKCEYPQHSRQTI